jgi:hypothetical protein
LHAVNATGHQAAAGGNLGVLQWLWGLYYFLRSRLRLELAHMLRCASLNSG